MPEARAERKRSREAELARVAELLALRSRQRGGGHFAGHYASAFRGGGLEFEESRPYVPGEDVRRLDWNATARSGEPYVKHFREERDRALFILLDVGAAMAFDKEARTKALAAAALAALLAAAAARAGDRVGLCAFDAEVRSTRALGRGAEHARRVVDAAFAAALRPSGASRLEPALSHAEDLLARRARSGALLICLSGHGAFADARGRVPARLCSLAARHEVLGLGILDPRERRLPSAGRLAIVDAASGGAGALIDSSRGASARRFERAVQRRLALVRREVRRAGASIHWIDSQRDALAQLLALFAERARVSPRRAEAQG